MFSFDVENITKGIGVYVNAGNYHEYSKQSISAYAKHIGVY